ncbi:hypothetical protein [uncultured Phenylobacterium sp.]|uniref:hypothetical protein n=1 Tax=uncultured Phenylobacterium sp. TaxID=349273 RepID=UPI0025E8D261|nr:hypothetical protein [uncultured Phenylobacterium sp.]
MIKNAFIAVLALCLAWFGSALARVENERYAGVLGMCDEFSQPLDHVKKLDCLKKQKTRTSPVWHVLYGLGVMGRV